MIHTSYTVGITTGEFKALQYVMVDQNEWINISLKNRARKASDEITKVIQSAMANAENNFGLNSNDLYISKAIADEGPTLKRFRPRARGRAGRINKRTSHLIIELASTEE